MLLSHQWDCFDRYGFKGTIAKFQQFTMSLECGPLEFGLAHVMVPKAPGAPVSVFLGEQVKIMISSVKI